MYYTRFPVESSVLSRQALASRVLSRYGLVQPVNCRFLQRSFNDTYVVTAGDSRYYLRVYRRGWRTKAQIEAEVDMLQFLAKRGHPVSGPVKRRDGAFLTRVVAPEGFRYCVLFTEAAGDVPPADLRRSRECGRILAEMHVSLDRRPVDSRRFHIDLPYLIDAPLERVRPLLRHRPDDFDYLRRVGDHLKAGVGTLVPQTAPYYGCCHGDLGFCPGGNIHEDANDNLALFDFDFFGYGYRAYDISVFLWNRAHQFGWGKTGRSKATRRWNVFVEGYSRVRSLQENELHAAKLFVAIRNIFGISVWTEIAETWGGGFFSDRDFDNAIGFIRQSIKHYKLL